MRMVPAYMVSIALWRLANSNVTPFRIVPHSYNPASDTWKLDDAEATKVELLNGPYFEAVLKILELNEKQ